MIAKTGTIMFCICLVPFINFTPLMQLSIPEGIPVFNTRFLQMWLQENTLNVFR